MVSTTITDYQVKLKHPWAATGTAAIAKAFRDEAA